MQDMEALARADAAGVLSPGFQAELARSGAAYSSGTQQPTAHQQAAAALAALMYAPLWHGSPDTEQGGWAAGQASSSAHKAALGGRASPDVAKGVAAHGGLPGRLLAHNTHVVRRLRAYLHKRSILALMASEEASSQEDQLMLAHLLNALDTTHHPPLRGIFARLLAASGAQGQQAVQQLPAAQGAPLPRLPAADATRPQDVRRGLAHRGPLPPGRLVPIKVTGLVLTVGWRVSAMRGGGARPSWWDDAMRGLQGTISFEIEVLRPACVGTRLDSSLATGDMQWQVQHATRVRWAAGKHDLLGTVCFECSITSAQMGEIGVAPADVLVRIRTLAEAHPADLEDASGSQQYTYSY